jgi:hypothetical protein
LSDCDDRYICVRELAGSWLELGVYARIGAYHIYQAWYLSNTGLICPRVWSKGLSCNFDHKHHPYWRFDLDPDGWAKNRANIISDDFIGFFSNEGGASKSAFPNTRWNVENLDTGAKAWILPSQTLIAPPTEDGPADGFSRFDIYLRKFRPSEEGDWPHDPEEEIGFPQHEALDESDIVVWYIGHLEHHEEDGENFWHASGPTILFEYPERPIEPESQRSVLARGSITVTMVSLTRRQVASVEFDESRQLDPSHTRAEIFIVRSFFDEIRVELRFNMFWQVDGAVQIDWSARFFEGASADTDDLEDQASSSILFMPDSSTTLSILLRNRELGSPDRTAITFSLTNSQL